MAHTIHPVHTIESILPLLDNSLDYRLACNLSVREYFRLDIMLHPQEMTAYMDGESQLFLVLLFLEWESENV